MEIFLGNQGRSPWEKLIPGTKKSTFWRNVMQKENSDRGNRRWSMGAYTRCCWLQLVSTALSIMGVGITLLACLAALSAVTFSECSVSCASCKIVCLKRYLWQSTIWQLQVLRKKDGFLAGEDTPVWLAEYNKKQRTVSYKRVLKKNCCLRSLELSYPGSIFKQALFLFLVPSTQNYCGEECDKLLEFSQTQHRFQCQKDTQRW